MAEYLNARIQIFTSDGKFLRMIGGRGQGIKSSVGVVVDASGMVYVSDTSVSVFTPEGQFVTSFGSRSQGLAVDNNGVVYVCSKNKIIVF